MNLGLVTLKSLFVRENRAPTRLPRALRPPVTMVCPPCSGNCMQGHACPAYLQRLRPPPTRTVP